MPKLLVCAELWLATRAHPKSKKQLYMTSRIVLAAALAVASLSANGEQPKPQGSVAAHCEKDVRDYLQALQFIRESAGSQISGRVVAGYVDEKTVREVQEKQGTCAAADLIRTKTASRRN